MVLIDRFKALSTKKKVILSSVTATVVIGIVVACILLSRGYYAKTMRLLRIEGTVNIEDANGNARPVLNNVRFNSGEALSTGSDGLASVGLDDTKIVTLENDSRVEFTKSLNCLELNLTQGGLYFEVTEHLEPDETFDIRTSTMTVGIRGASGYVFYDDDGCVHVVATNPDTGEIRETDVHGGYRVKVYLYDETPTPTVTPTPTPSPEPEEEEVVEEIDWSEPQSIPAGYEDYIKGAHWGNETYDGHPVYILSSNEDDTCLCYLGNDEWVEGQYIIENSFVDEYGSGWCTGYYYHDADGNEVAYYEYAYEYHDYSEVPDPDEPNYPNASVPGYSYADFVYGDEFKGHPTYIVVEEYSADGSSGVTTYYAYYPSEWVPLTLRLTSDGTVMQFVLPDGMVYYEAYAN